MRNSVNQISLSGNNSTDNATVNAAKQRAAFVQSLLELPKHELMCKLMVEMDAKNLAYSFINQINHHKEFNKFFNSKN